jgi:protein-S-isoprenylcysteine O-methyltransferase Ste14
MIGKHVVLTLLVAAGAISTIWRFGPGTWGTMQIVGVFLLVCGFVLWTIARFQLGRSFTVTPQATQLITHGLYAKFRNPIYIFGSCVLVGVILTLGRPIWLLAFLIIIPLQIWRAGKEASVLEAKFGDDYRRYKASTWF